MEILEELVRIETLINHEQVDSAINAMNDLANEHRLYQTSLERLISAESANHLINKYASEAPDGSISAHEFFSGVKDPRAMWFEYDSYNDRLLNVTTEDAKAYLEDLVDNLKDDLIDELRDIQNALVEQLEIIQNACEEEALEEPSSEVSDLIEEVNDLTSDTFDSVMTRLMALTTHNDIRTLEDESVEEAWDEIETLLDTDLSLATYFEYLS